MNLQKMNNMIGINISIEEDSIKIIVDCSKNKCPIQQRVLQFIGLYCFYLFGSRDKLEVRRGWVQAVKEPGELT